MSDDLVSRLRVKSLGFKPEPNDTLRFMAGIVPLIEEAAQALSEARAEIEEWRQEASVEAGLRREFFTRAEKAESELSTLRARVREVVGLGLDVISEERGWGTYPRMEGSEIYTDADVFSRAARQLMEEVK